MIQLMISETLWITGNQMVFLDLKLMQEKETVLGDICILNVFSWVLRKQMVDYGWLNSVSQI